MKTTVKNLKVGDIFTDSGITVKVTSITKDQMVNGKDCYLIAAVSIDYNKKMFPKMQLGLDCFYTKKIDTIISIR
jgi:preprotein translocase subunit YajC